ncbi:hypothetical protein D3C76_831780 [compost metagenome]
MVYAFGLHYAFKVVMNIKFDRCTTSETLYHQTLFGENFTTGTKVGPVQGNGADTFIIKI